MTNFEKIKALSKEEMARYIFDLGNGREYCYGHCAFQDNEDCPNEPKQCIFGVIKWLESEVEE